MNEDNDAYSRGIDQLYSLFEWHPPALLLAPVKMGGSRSKSSRPPAFYDKHLASHLTCRKLVHIPNLHKKVACVVDQKLDALRGPGGQINLAPITSDTLTSEKLRDEVVTDAEHRMKDEKAVVEFYAKTTGNFCVRVASTIALHPTSWKSVLNWSASTSQRSKAICDGSLQVRSYLPHMDDLMDPDRLKELMEVGEHYKDLATWEMKSLSVGNVGVMLEVMSMVIEGGQFSWSTCTGSCVNDKKPRQHKTETALRGADAIETLEFFTAFWNDHDMGDHDTFESQESNISDTNDDKLDRALRRGGSSLEQAKKFNRELEADGRRAQSKILAARSVKRLPNVETLTSPPAKVRFQEPEKSDKVLRPSPSRKRKAGSEGAVASHEVTTAQSLIQQVNHLHTYSVVLQLTTVCLIGMGARSPHKLHFHNFAFRKLRVCMLSAPSIADALCVRHSSLAASQESWIRQTTNRYICGDPG